MQGGDVIQENITANVSEDTVILDFLRLDGVYVSQLVDFTNVSDSDVKKSTMCKHFCKHHLLKFHCIYILILSTENITVMLISVKEVEAMKVVIPAEEELGQSGFQTLCFLTHAAQADFIAPDAMAKLRQVSLTT